MDDNDDYTTVQGSAVESSVAGGAAKQSVEGCKHFDCEIPVSELEEANNRFPEDERIPQSELLQLHENLYRASNMNGEDVF